MSNCDLNTECYLVFPFKIKDISDVLNIVKTVKKNSVSSISDSKEIETVDATVISDEPIAIEAPKKRKKVRRIIKVGKQMMDFYQIGDILYPEEPERQKRYRKVGGRFERDYRNPDKTYKIEEFTKDINREIYNAKRRKKPRFA